MCALMPSSACSSALIRRLPAAAKAARHGPGQRGSCRSHASSASKYSPAKRSVSSAVHAGSMNRPPWIATWIALVIVA
jgi:hypothetical protein